MTHDRNNPIEVSVIIVSYNTKDMTLAAIRSVIAETTLPHEIIVLDNASADGSAEAVAAAFPEVRLLAETENHGFAQGNNIAARLARGRYILLLNPDTVVLDGAIDTLVRFADERADARIWGGLTFDGTGETLASNAWSRMTVWSLFCQVMGFTRLFRKSALFNPEAMPGWDRSAERRVDIITGCFLLIRREDWERLGGFDRKFFMYGEEADLCLRAEAELGARPAITPESRIIHYEGASETIRADKVVRLLKARISLIDRHMGRLQAAVARRLTLLWPFSRMLALSLIGRTEPARAWREIWQRRAEWRDGYPDPVAGPGTSDQAAREST